MGYTPIKSTRTRVLRGKTAKRGMKGERAMKYEKKVEKRFAKAEAGALLNTGNGIDEGSYWLGYAAGMLWIATAWKKSSIKNMKKAIKKHRKRIEELRERQSTLTNPIGEEARKIAERIEDHRKAIEDLTSMRNELMDEVERNPFRFIP